MTREEAMMVLRGRQVGKTKDQLRGMYRVDLRTGDIVNGLIQDWGGQRVYCNPPYGRTVGDWVEKAAKESRKENTIVVMLLPARTDTKWFHKYIYGRATIRFIRGRLKFGGSKNSAPFPSMIVIF